MSKKTKRATKKKRLRKIKDLAVEILTGAISGLIAGALVELIVRLIEK